MKSITEFTPFLLQKVLTTKTQLLADGKTEEEVSASIGETFKIEGDRLKYALAASDLVKDKSDVRRILVVSFAEGEATPAQYQKIDENYYLVEALNLTKPMPSSDKGKRGGPRGKGTGGPKSSPWGMSPEEKEAKNNKAVAKAAAAKA
jgi:hypothetical protein